MAPRSSVSETPDSRTRHSPRPAVTEEPKLLALCPEPPPLPGPGGARRILVVDDSRAMRGIIFRTLRRAGLGAHCFIEAASGEEALGLVRAGLPDLLLVDWNMPGMNGVELLRRLRAEGFEVEVGFITAEAPRMRAEALEAGARFVLSKPVTVESVRSVLGDLLGPTENKLPARETVAELLSALLGQRVEVQLETGTSGFGPMIAGLFEAPRRGLALLAWEQPLAAALAAAMLGEPADRAAEWAALPNLPEVALESLAELLRVSAPLFGSGGAGPVTLTSVHERLQSLPSRAIGLAVSVMSSTDQPAAEVAGYDRVSFRVELGALGGGRLLFLC